MLIFILGAVCAAVAMFLWFPLAPPCPVCEAAPPLHAAPQWPDRPAVDTAASPAALATATAPARVDASPQNPKMVSVSAQSVQSAARTSLPNSAVNGLLIPVAGVKPTELRDTFNQARREGRVHDAIDIPAPRGTPVLAAHDGKVVKLFTSKRGGLTVYQFDPSGRVVYYYAHLDHYAPGVAAGKVLRRGDVLGFVGSTGNARADAPHLHFEIGMLGAARQWWHSTPINPFGRFKSQDVAIPAMNSSAE